MEEREMFKMSQASNVKVKEINEVRKKIVNLDTEKIEMEKMRVNAENELQEVEQQLYKLKQEQDPVGKQLDAKEKE